MKTRTGYETNGKYLKFKSGYTSCWNVETEKDMKHFKTEYEADMYIITKVIGCEISYPTCKHYTEQIEGCNNCKYGFNSNCSN